METYEGTVSGIDVQAIPGQPPRSQTFIAAIAGDEIQVTANDLSLLTALEHAAARGVRVEVSFVKDENLLQLTRVRVLDRG